MANQDDNQLAEDIIGGATIAEVICDGYEAIHDLVADIEDPNRTTEEIADMVWLYALDSLARNRTVNGVQISTVRLYPEGDYWRWQIIDANGREFVDGGNYRTSRAAAQGLIEALEAA